MPKLRARGVNLILFDPAETQHPLPRADRRARHILDVLRRQIGDTFDAGLVNGPRGKGTVAHITPEALALTFQWSDEPAPAADPLALLIGLPRPQTARDILRDASTLGVAAMHFVRTEKGEPNYAQSSLWSSGEWRRHVLAGAEQAFDTRVPVVTHGSRLPAVLAALPSAGSRLALDNYESAIPLSAADISRRDVLIAIGPERGWSATERDILRAHGFTLVHLGSRILRTETAVTAALAIVRAKLHLM